MNLRELRTSKGLSPSFIAKKLNITPRHFCRIEKGEGYLTRERAKKLATIYDTKMSEIVECYGGDIHE